MGRGEAGVDLESRLKGSMGMKPPLGAPAAQAEAAGEGVTMDLDWIRLVRLWLETWLLRTCWWTSCLESGRVAWINESVLKGL